MEESDFYPSEEALKEIEEFDLESPRLFRRLPEFMRLVLGQWHWGGQMYKYDTKTGCLEMHTGGWSGNEDIIKAMKKHKYFWWCFWVQSRRGGHYWFKLYQYEENGTTRIIPDLGITTVDRTSGSE
jgi:hypothetical protein